MKKSRRLVALLVCASLGAGVLAGGCGDDEGPMATAAGAPAAESTNEIKIADFKYAPERVTVDVGTELVWTNGDQAPHTATADDGSFDTGTLDRDDSGRATFDQPGTYSYYCRFHPFMKATVEVQ